MSTTDAVGAQLGNFKKAKAGAPPERLTTSNGVPLSNLTETLTVGPNGPALMQDFAFIDHMAHFNREPVPPRVVHAKGAGAFGYFEVTHDITKYCKAKVFSSVGKRTPIAVRFSSAMSEQGNPDMVRDVKGMAVKFYTEEGNWDLVGNNSPIFFIRDSILFPSLVHSLMRNPITHMRDPEAAWDFWSSRPESTHQVMMFFTDRAIPDGYRHMHGFGANTFKMVNSEGEAIYCKFHYLTNQGIKNLEVPIAGVLNSTDPDYYIRDLYNALTDKNFPSWTLYIQVMTFEQAENYQFNPFDVTKVWLHKDFPLIEVGQLVLDRYPQHFFAEVEQIAFSPAHLVPGIEPSPDRVLQGRLFSYSDAHRHRLMTPNYQQLPVNRPRCPISNYQQNGLSFLGEDRDGAPHFFPNSFGGPAPDPSFAETKFGVTGDVARYPLDEDYYTQPRLLWDRVLKRDERDRMVDNIAEHLQHVSPMIQLRALENFSHVKQEFADAVRKLIGEKQTRRSKNAAINMATINPT